MEKFDRRVGLRLPENVTLDESYQQTKLTATNGKGKESSNVGPQDVPKGILIIPSGSRDPLLRWAVSEPRLVALERDKNGTVTQYGFGMHLFCSVEGSDFARQTEAGCTVDVVVCFKPKK